MTRPAPGLRAAPAAIAMAMAVACATAAHADTLDLSSASIVIPHGPGRHAERLAASVLAEEVARRTGLTWVVTSTWPVRGVAIALAAAEVAGWDAAMPAADGRAEGYRIASASRDGLAVIWITAADARGVLYGVGGLLRRLAWTRGRAAIDTPFDVTTAPRYAIRGHQLGYRHHSNTYDGWDEARYEQYVRELALLGANAIENIPFQDARVSPLMPMPRDQMTRRVSALCAKYGLQYWLWLPAEFDLRDAARRADALGALERVARDLPRLDAIFVPGGDPGDNPAPLVVPYLRDVAAAIARHHPGARVWLSLQRFDAAEIDLVFDWIDRDRPAWLGGLVAGPGSYPVADTRRRLHRQYPLRDYPDITHTVRSQYPVPWWDPAFNLTLGREPVNPRPVFYASLHHRVAPHTDGFISYSDGVNDDLNKALWTLKAWEPDRGADAIVLDYARLFFGAAVATRAAEGLLALERNWDGPLAANAGVDATLALWQQLDAASPDLSGNWRWQMHLMRAYYDAYTRRRLLSETAIEEDALEQLASAPRLGAGEAMDRAERILARASSDPCCPAWRQRIEALCDALFQTVRLQTSVPKHSASGAERGAVLDFVDHPLNNRWWLEDQFALVRAMPDEASRRKRLATLAAWSRPGDGSFYDDVGHVGESPRVARGPTASDADDDGLPHYTWEGGPSRSRLSWLTSMRWPAAITYTALDPAATYVVRLTVIRPGSPGEVRLRIDGEPAVVSRAASVRGDWMEFAVPERALRDGALTLTFDEVDERAVNWREYSRLAEAWLIRQ